MKGYMSTLAETSKKAILAMTLAGGLFTASHALAVTFDGLDRSFQLINSSRNAITEIYATNVDDPVFHSNGDMLGRYTLAPGANKLVRPPIDEGYCLFDVGVKFEDGSTDLVTRVNLCTAQALEFYNGGHRVLRNVW
jgi:hypothetical protein